MPDNSPSHKELEYYSVWDRTTRWFHWINVICIIGLVSVGVVILNHKVLGINNDGKLLLKTVHVYIGYVFVLNLIWRFIWGFIGNKFVRWKAVLPIGKGYWHSVNEYIAGTKAGDPPQYLGHNRCRETHGGFPVPASCRASDNRFGPGRNRFIFTAVWA